MIVRIAYLFSLYKRKFRLNIKMMMAKFLFVMLAR